MLVVDDEPVSSPVDVVCPGPVGGSVGAVSAALVVSPAPAVVVAPSFVMEVGSTDDALLLIAVADVEPVLLSSESEAMLVLTCG
ncbi:hypothetical protein [Nannocystis sp. SCPEA4]|uniref:hypothetical protein n=1 Tax=Nannocystis sp. SCPEA4 TaxID=2996787 RepID=UPI00226F9C80|nr:hypothetical protein [Nannocystis sp. SCPEA4]MCY1059608.1 hypothetical protein [Nannocystis sp. SCPEA4]